MPIIFLLNSIEDPILTNLLLSNRDSLPVRAVVSDM